MLKIVFGWKMYKETCKQILQNILKIAYMFFRKGKGHFCPKNKEKKDTSVFSKIQRTFLSPQKALLILKEHFCTLVFRN